MCSLRCAGGPVWNSMLTIPPYNPFDADSPTTPDSLEFREGMSRVAGAVHVVTTEGPSGRAGFTATAMTPVTDSPASLLVCVNTASRSAQALLANGVFC